MRESAAGEASRGRARVVRLGGRAGALSERGKDFGVREKRQVGRLGQGGARRASRRIEAKILEPNYSAVGAKILEPDYSARGAEILA